jgi:hypothetical protein
MICDNLSIPSPGMRPPLMLSIDTTRSVKASIRGRNRSCLGSDVGNMNGPMSTISGKRTSSLVGNNLP